MTIYRIIAAAAFAFAGLAASTASAAPTIAGGVYQEQILKTCSALSSCEILFTAVPAAKTLVVSDIACVATMTNTASVSAASLAGRKADNTLVQRTVYPLPVQVSNFGGIRRYQIQEQVRHVLLAGEKPRMFIGATAAPAEFVTICTVSGELK